MWWIKLDSLTWSWPLTKCEPISVHLIPQSLWYVHKLVCQIPHRIRWPLSFIYSCKKNPRPKYNMLSNVMQDYITVYTNTALGSEVDKWLSGWPLFKFHITRRFTTHSWLNLSKDKNHPFLSSSRLFFFPPPPPNLIKKFKVEFFLIILNLFDKNQVDYFW